MRRHSSFFFAIALLTAACATTGDDTRLVTSDH